MCTCSSFRSISLSKREECFDVEVVYKHQSVPCGCASWRGDVQVFGGALVMLTSFGSISKNKRYAYVLRFEACEKKRLEIFGFLVTECASDSVKLKIFGDVSHNVLCTKSHLNARSHVGYREIPKKANEKN